MQRGKHKIKSTMKIAEIICVLSHSVPRCNIMSQHYPHNSIAQTPARCKDFHLGVVNIYRFDNLSANILPTTVFSQNEKRDIMPSMKKQHSFQKILCLALTLIFVLSLCGCAKAHERSLFAMDTFIELKCFGINAEDALDACEAEIRRLEGLLSATLIHSDVSRINGSYGSPVTVDADTAALLQQAKELSRATDGAFDITVRPLVELWGFPDTEQHVPSQQEIDALLPIATERAIDIDGTTVTLTDETKIDLGGIAKGYCSERLRQLMKERGIKSALISLGGNVEAIGAKPDGSAWRIAIRDPWDEQRVIGVVEVIDCAVVTAGSYQRYFERDGIRYHHILDPKTGFPGESGLCSVTVIAQSGTRADALSTAFFVLGAEASLALLETQPFSDCEAVFVTTDGEILCSDGVHFLSIDGE